MFTKLFYPNYSLFIRSRINILGYNHISHNAMKCTNKSKVHSQITYKCMPCQSFWFTERHPKSDFKFNYSAKQYAEDRKTYSHILLYYTWLGGEIKKSLQISFKSFTQWNLSHKIKSGLWKLHFIYLCKTFMHILPAHLIWLV